MPRNVRRPGIKKTAEIIIPFVAGELLLESAPFGVRFDNIADATKMYCAIFDSDIGIANPNRLRVWVFPELACKELPTKFFGPEPFFLKSCPTLDLEKQGFAAWSFAKRR